MKKLIAIAVVLALVAGVAFAQTANGIQVQAWGRGAFTPLKVVTAEQANGEKVPDAEDDSFAGVTPSWGAGKGWSNGLARVDIRINGNSDYVGFGFNGTFENYGFNDNAALIWAKPFGSDILKLTVGQFVDDTLRGKIGNLDGGFSNFVLPNTPEEDAIFYSFAVGAGRGSANAGDGDAGFMISSAPIDGLFFGLLVKGKINDLGTRTATAYRYMQLGAGYNIGGIGHIRAQYIGGWSGEIDPDNKDYQKSVAAGDDYWYYEGWALDDDGNPKGDWVVPGNGITVKSGSIQAGFALTAVEGLLIDLGARIWLPLTFKGSDAKYTNGLDFSLGAQFNSGAFGIGARVDITKLGAGFQVNSDDKSEFSSETIIRVVPTFGVGEATIGLDFALALQGKSKDNDGKDVEKSGGSQIGFGAFVSKGLGNGNIRAGLSYTLPPNNYDGKASGSGVFQIPIILEYAFF